MNFRCWLAGHRDPAIGQLGGKLIAPGATLHHPQDSKAEYRIQDRGYYRLQGDTGYRILHATRLEFSKDTGHIGYRMQD